MAVSEIGGNLRAKVNLVVGLGSSLPVAVGAVGVGVLTGSRRRRVDFFSNTWPGLLLKATGVRVDVTGEQHLTERRPAVFLYNHRNQVDPFIAASLMAGSWVAIAKKELRQDPVIGNILRMMEVAFLDRGDTAAALQTLREIEARVANGTSVLVAPEGTSHHAPGIGVLKKGAFRIAMNTGVPIVPIVIRNAELVASRNSALVEPGTVDAAVLPPIPVDTWTADTLTDRIAEVRQLYLDTLADWPPGRQAPRSSTHQ